jgi:hypothetical protein
MRDALRNRGTIGAEMKAGVHFDAACITTNTGVRARFADAGSDT